MAADTHDGADGGQSAPVSPPPHAHVQTNRARFLAAGGASLLSALVVNPLDVVKTRMQAQAAHGGPAHGSTSAACRFYASLPVRSHSSAAPATPLRDALPSSLARNLWDRLKALRSSPSQLLGGGAGAPPEWQPRLAGAGLSGCGCAEASLLEAPGSSSSSSGRPRFAGEGCGARGPAGPQGMLATFKQMLRQEGPHALYRGLDSALLLTVPSVLLYYPLYDALMGRALQLQLQLEDEARRGSASSASGSGGSGDGGAGWVGAAAPMVCGAAARTVAAFAVAPLELARTRQQAGAPAQGPQGEGAGQAEARRAAHASASTSAAGAGGTGGADGAAASQRRPVMNTWGVLRSGLGLEGGGGSGGVLRALPRLWVGFGATVARDVPFSALYWGMLEPIRAAMLARTMPDAPATNGFLGARDGAACSTTTTTAASSSSSSSSSSSGSRAAGAHKSPWAECEMEWLVIDAAAGSMAPPSPCMLGHLHQHGGPGWDCCAGSAGSGTSSSTAAPSTSSSTAAPSTSSSTGAASRSSRQVYEAQQAAGFSGAQLLWANLVAGSVSGAVAAAATTPFDVVKTRMQIAGGQGGGPPPGLLAVARQVHAEGGARALFVGMGPRAARCAPACAIVVGCYELLKSWL